MGNGEIRLDGDESSTASETWPALPLEPWKATCDTLHLWTQIVGKIRMALTPPVNHWWHVPLYVTSRGLGTSPIPYDHRVFEIEFDLCAHELRIITSDRQAAVLPLQPMTVATFYRRLMSTLADLDILVRIHAVPVEVPDPIPFEEDVLHAAYDGEHAQRFWRTLLQAAAALQRFRSGFIGKASPVNFFWGSFDLAVSVYSGRRAPAHPGTPGVPAVITAEAYSHEVAAFGFWPGDDRYTQAAFYAYAYPEPAGYSRSPVPVGAFYSTELGEFLLPLDAVRGATDPDGLLDGFARSTYLAAAILGEWERNALEREWFPAGPEERSGERGADLHAP